jgi:hypothetical protein
MLFTKMFSAPMSDRRVRPGHLIADERRMPFPPGSGKRFAVGDGACGSGLLGGGL